MEPIEAMASLPLQRGEPMLARVRQNVPHAVRQVAAGGVLVPEGQALDGVLVVQAGILSLSARAPSGKRALLAFLGPGDVVAGKTVFGHERPDARPETRRGEAPPTARSRTAPDRTETNVDRLPDSATEVRAVVRSDVLFLSATDVADVLRRDTLVQQWLLAGLIRRAQTLERALARTLSLPVRDRVLDALRELAMSHGRSTPWGIRVLVPLTQEDIGALVGATRESVNRAIRQLVGEGVVRRWGDSYVVCERLGDRHEARRTRHTVFGRADGHHPDGSRRRQPPDVGPGVS